MIKTFSLINFFVISFETKFSGKWVVIGQTDKSLLYISIANFFLLKDLAIYSVTPRYLFSKVLVLSKVKIKNEANGMEMDYMIVADGEADLASGKLSVNSPIGKGLLGKSVGDIAEISVPNGKIRFKILEISR